MKKIAKIMALVMMMSGLNAFAITANAASDVNVINFSDKSVSSNAWVSETFSSATATGAVMSNLTVANESGTSYQKVDDEHGTSAAIRGGAGIGYIFNRTFDGDGKAVYNTVTGKIRYSADVYAKKGDDTARVLLQFNDQKYDWETLLIDFYAGKGYYEVQNEKTGVHPRGDLVDGAWYRVDIDIDADADSAVADVYVNGNFISTREIPEAIHSVWFTSNNLGSGTSNGMYIDNIVVETEDEFSFANSIDFNEKAASKDLWASAAYSGATETGSVLLRNNDTGASYQKIDDEHQTSYVMAGGASFQYVFNRTFDESNAKVENIVTGKFKYSFDMYHHLDAQNGRVMLQLNKDAYDENVMLAYIKYGENKYHAINKNGSFTWDNLPYASETWYNVDVIFDATQTSTTASLYINNELIGTKTFNQPLKSFWFTTQGQYVAVKSFTAIDNVKVTQIAEDSYITATPLLTTISEDAESVAIRYSETLSRESVNSEPQVTVTEKNKDTNTVRTIDAYAEIDYTATKLNVFFNENLDDNCEYTIALPAELTGLFGREISTESVIVTTKAGMDYFDDFDNYTNAAKMPRFSNREFSGTEGYYGKALTSEYSQNSKYVLPEAIDTASAKTDYIVSFDMKIPDSSKYIQLYVSYNSDSVYQWRGSDVKTEWTNVGKFTQGEWHHYDMVFDFDKSQGGRLYLYQDGEYLSTSKSYAIWGTLSYINFFAEAGYPYHIDNFHVRYRNDVEAETTLNGVISPSTKQATIKFDDAVKASTLNTDNIKIYYNKFDELEYTIKSADAYSVTLEFADGAFEDNTQYTLNIDGVETCAGEPITENIFRFTAIEKFDVTDAKIMDGATQITTVGEWNNEKTYKVEVTLDSTRTSAQTIYAVVAGYTGAGKLVNVGVEPIEVSVSGNYDGELEALDMTGAEYIKVFVIDGFTNLSPLMAQAKVID